MAATNQSMPLSKRDSTLNDGDRMGNDSYKEEQFSDDEESFSVHDDSQIKASAKDMARELKFER